MVRWFKDRESFEYFRSNKQMKMTKPTLWVVWVVCALFLVSLISVVCGQRCINDANWEDMGRDGCVNFVANAEESSWSGAAWACFQYEYAGRYAQLLRFRDTSQDVADASFDALYARFYANTMYMDKVWVNVYRGGDSTPSRSANVHGYKMWLKPSYTNPYTPYRFLPQNGNMDGTYYYRWKDGEPNDWQERCYDVWIDKDSDSGLNDELCTSNRHYSCQMPAL